MTKIFIIYYCVLSISNPHDPFMTTSVTLVVASPKNWKYQLRDGDMKTDWITENNVIVVLFLPPTFNIFNCVSILKSAKTVAFIFKIEINAYYFQLFFCLKSFSSSINSLNIIKRCTFLTLHEVLALLKLLY